MIAITIFQDYGCTLWYDRRTWSDGAKYLVVTLDKQLTLWTHVAYSNDFQAVVGERSLGGKEKVYELFFNNLN